ncbi:MAG TPA: hypothetical protein VII06_12385 [Chloroflexota bacterium]|jgi:hypothetical protein
MKRREPERFEVTDWRDVDKLYPGEWLAIEVEEVTPGVGITKGVIIARSRREAPVVNKLKQRIEINPELHYALVNPGRKLKPGEDMLLGTY